MKEVKEKNDTGQDLFPALFSNFFGVEVTEDDATLVFGQRRKEKVVTHTRVAVTHKGLRKIKELISKAIKDVPDKS